MAKAADQFRPSDVTLWGLVALFCWGGAVLLSNVSAVLPSSVLASLHASRLEGGTMSQLRSQIATLSEESRRMRAENNLLLQRFDRSEESAKETARRLGALELTVPAALERQSESAGVGIDSMPTASIGAGRVTSFDAEGGSVSVEQKPLVTEPFSGVERSAVRPLANADAFGLALGFPIRAEDAEAQWQGLAARVGTLLIGLAPLLQPIEGTDDMQIVAGPITDRAQAEQLCTRMDRVGIPCAPQAFAGEPLPLLN